MVFLSVHPVGPLLQLLNLGIGREHMVHALILSKSVIGTSSKYKSVIGFGVDEWDFEFMDSWVRIKKVIENEIWRVEGSNRGEACQLQNRVGPSSCSGRLPAC